MVKKLRVSCAKNTVYCPVSFMLIASLVKALAVVSCSWHQQVRGGC